MRFTKRLTSYAAAATIVFGQIAPVFAEQQVFRMTLGNKFIVTDGSDDSWLPPDLGGNFEPTGDILIDINPSIRARIGVPTNIRLTAQNAVGAVEWDYAGGSLPTGLSFDATIGSISGTPTAVQTTEQLVVRAVDEEGKYGLSRAFVVDVKPAPSISIPASLEADGATAFSAHPGVEDVYGSQTWSIDGILPYGISVDASTGELRGRTQQSGTFSDLRLKVVDGDGATGLSTPFSIESTTTLAVQGIGKSFRIRAGKPFFGPQPSVIGATAAIAWSIADSNAPEGLDVTPATGIISGTPTTPAKTESVYLKATQADGQSAVHGPMTFDVVGDMTLAQNDIYVRSGQYVAEQVLAENAIGQLSWSLSGNSLPSGLYFSDSGRIFGRPVATSTRSGFVATAIDLSDGGSASTPEFSIHVWPELNVLVPGMPKGTVDQPLTISAPTATGLRGNATWSIAGGSLPPGLAFDVADATISGTPTQAGTWSFRYAVVDEADLQAATSNQVSLTINPLPVPGAMSFGEMSDAFHVRSGGTLTSSTPIVLNARGATTFEILGDAPDWLSVNADTGQVFGVAPTTNDDISYANLQISATDAEGRSATSPAFSVLVHAPGPLRIGLIGPTLRAIADTSFDSGTAPIIGGSGAFSLRIDGDLPAWLSFDPASGRLFGTPTDADSDALGLSLRASDLVTGETAISNPFDATILLDAGTSPDSPASGIPSISGMAAQYAARVGQSFSTGVPTVSNLASGHAFAFASTATPAWLEIDTATGRIFGLPVEAGSYGPFSVRVSDPTGQTALSTPFTILVSAADPMSALVSPSYQGAFGQPFSLQPTTSNAMGAVSWSLATGSLPDWATLSPSTGRIAGIPDQIGTVSGLSLKAVDEKGNSATTRGFSIAIAPPPPMTLASMSSAFEAEINSALTISAPAVANGTAPYAWSIASGTLPSWASLDASTGRISGTPTALGSVSGLSLRAVDSTGNSATSSTFSISVSPAQLRVSSAPSPAPFRAGASLTTSSPVVTGAVATITWDLARGSLPPWAALNAETGQISGTSVDAGTWSGIVLRASERNSGRQALSAPIQIAVVSSFPEVSVQSSIEGRTHRALQVSPSASAILGTPSWRVSAGQLPDGLSLNASTGMISGTPISVGTTVGIVLTVTDSRDGREGSSLPITINVADGTPYIDIADNHVVRVGQAFQISPVLHDAVGATTWAVTGGTLPNWAAMNASTGRISGTPTTATSIDGIRLTATDSRGISGHSSTFSILSRPALVASSDQTSITIRTGESIFTATPTAQGVAGTALWSSSGGLPSGTSLDANTGIVSGVARGTGTYPVSLILTDSIDGAQATAAPYTISVLGAPSATMPTTSVAARVGYEVSVAPSASNTIGTRTWSVHSGTIPAWATLDPSSGRIAGTPTDAGASSNVVLKVIDSTGASATTQSFRFEVAPRIRIDLPSTAAAGRVQKTFSFAPIAADGAIGAVTWSASSLPEWATINPETGRVLGTPPAASTFSFSLTATDSAGNVATSAPIGATISTNPIVTTSDRETRVNASFSYQPGISGVVGGYSVHSVGSPLPSWATMTSTGRIHGFPDATGTWSGLQIRVIDSEGVSGTSVPFSITVSSGISVAATTDVTEMRIGRTVSVSAPAVSNAVGGIVWSLASGELPSGLSVSSSTGTISGQSTSDGLYTYRLRATDSHDGAYALSAERSIRIWPSARIADVAAEYVAHADIAFSLSPAPRAVNARGSRTWSVLSGTLPDWASLDASTGQITGMPTAGTWSAIRLRYVDSVDGDVAYSAPFTIRIVPEMTVSNMSTTYSARYGFPFVQALPQATNAIPPVSWELVQGTLPAWAALDPATGRISGTSDEIGTWSDLAVEVTDATGQSARSILFDLSSYSEPSVAMPSGPLQFRVGTAATISPTGRGTVGTPLWSVTSGQVPDGMTLNSVTGRISGTPSAPGTYPFTLRMTDGFDGKYAEGTASAGVLEALGISGIDDEHRIRMGAYLTTGQAALTGARGTVSFSSIGSLPAGLSFSGGRYSGLISTGQAPTTYDIVVRGRDSFDGAHVDHAFTITTLGTLSTTAPSFNLRSGADLPGTAPAVSNRVGEPTWTLASGTLPDGVSLDASTGILAGTVSASERTVWSDLRLRVTDSDGATALSNAFSITVDGDLGLSGPAAAEGVKGTAFAQALTASNALGTVSWSAIGLPPGLRVSGSGLRSMNGSINGTPTSPGTYEATITARDTLDNSTSSHTISIFIDTVPVISMGPVLAYLGTAVSVAPSIADKGTGTVTWQLTLPDGSSGVSSLPAGLTFNSSTGSISGTATSTTPSSGIAMRMQAVERRSVAGQAVDVMSNVASFTVRSTAPDPIVSMSDVPGTRGSPVPSSYPIVENKLGTSPQFQLRAYTGTTLRATYGTIYAGNDYPYFPKGMTFDASTGRIAGTPEKAWSTSYWYELEYRETRTISGTTSTAVARSEPFRIPISDWASAQVTMPDVSGTLGEAVAPQSPTVVKGPNFYSGSFILRAYTGTTLRATYGTIYAGNDYPYFPKGMTFDAATGRIAGTPEKAWSTSYWYELEYTETRRVNGVSYTESVRSNEFRIPIADWADPQVTMEDVSGVRGSEVPSQYPTVMRGPNFYSGTFQLRVYTGTTHRTTYGTISTSSDQTYFPKGMGFDAATGRIYGTPEKAWSTSYWYELEYIETRRVNGNYQTEAVRSNEFRIPIADWADPQISMTDVSGVRGSEVPSQYPTVMRGPNFYSGTFQLRAYTGTTHRTTYGTISTSSDQTYFPKGMGFDAATGRIFGTPAKSWTSYYWYELEYIETRRVNGEYYTVSVRSEPFRILIADWAAAQVTMADISGARGVSVPSQYPTVMRGPNFYSGTFQLRAYTGTTHRTTYGTISTSSDQTYFPKGMGFDASNARIFGTPQESWSSYYWYELEYIETRRVNGENYTETARSAPFRILID